MSAENKSRPWIDFFVFRVLPFILLIALLLIFLGPSLFRSCTTRQVVYLLTQAKMQKLKAVMSQISVLAVEGFREFPRSREQILDFMEQERGEMVSRGETDLNNPLVDGWGRALRFQGDLDYYELRSSGKDGAMDTPDDIYIQGDAQGEYLVDGTGQKSLTSRDLVTSTESVPFEEPYGYYRILMPGSYTLVQSFENKRSEIIFSYARDMRVWIKAEPGFSTWQPESSLKERLEVLRRGEDDLYTEFEVSAYRLLKVGDSPGFGLTLKRGHIVVRELQMVSASGLAVTITLVTSGAEASDILEVLEKAVLDTLVITYRN
jgi:hypothetical protein